MGVLSKKKSKGNSNRNKLGSAKSHYRAEKGWGNNKLNMYEEAEIV